MFINGKDWYHVTEEIKNNEKEKIIIKKKNLIN